MPYCFHLHSNDVSLPAKCLYNLTEAWYTWNEWKILLPAEQRASALAFVVDGCL